jgi:SPP1 gp7 family putative phage head morphogenesis protein
MLRYPALSPEFIQGLRARHLIAVSKRNRRRKEYRVPIQRYPRPVQLQYLSGLRRLLNVSEEIIREIIFPDLNKIALSGAEYVTRKVDNVRIAVEQNISAAEIEMLTTRAGKQLSQFNANEINKQLRSVIGIDLIREEPWLAEHIRMFRTENVNLVTSLRGTQLDDLENILARGFRQGLRAEAMRDQLINRFDVSKSKASLIARDQVGKLNGELTQLRQESIGVTSYIWRASLDERVRGNPAGHYPKARPSHYARDGKRFKWSEPPQEDQYDGHPGIPINCRCRAEPDLSFLIGEDFAPKEGRGVFALSPLAMGKKKK